MSLGNKEIFRDVRFIGAFILLVLASSFYFYKTIQKNKEADAYLANPKVNDFFFIDYSKYGVETRPNERYRLARLVDITGEWYTVVYGNYFLLKLMFFICTVLLLLLYLHFLFL